MPVTKEQLKAFIDYMSDLLEKHRVREGDDYVVPFFEKTLEGMGVTYVDMHGIYCMCREVMDTFDWEHFDLIFTPAGNGGISMITKEQFHQLLFVTAVYSSLVQIYSTMNECPMEELPDELKEDSIKLFSSVEELIERYNGHIQNAVKMSGLPD